MRKIFLPLLLASFWGAKAQAADIFVKQAASGGNTGADCTNARAYTTLVAGDYANRIVICTGTITVPTNTTGFTIGADNATILFQAGAILQSQAFPYPTGGAIDCNGHNHVTIDGGGTVVPALGAPTDAGLIQNTNNGDLLTFQQNSAIINCGTTANSNTLVQNLRVSNVYVRQQNNAAANGDTTLGIYVGGSNSRITHNTLDHARYPIYSPYSPAGLSNIEIDHNSETFIEVCSVIGDTGAGSVFTGFAKYHDNLCGGGNYLWDQGPSLLNNFHHNGIHWWRVATGSTFSGIQVYNNEFSGCFGQDVAYANQPGTNHGLTHITGIIYLETVGDGALVFNNVIDVTACAPLTGWPQGLNFGDNGQIYLKTSGTPSQSTRNAVVVNNTIISNQGRCAEADSTGTVWRNNICTGPVYAVYTPNGANNTTITPSNNDYWQSNNWGVFDTFASWQTKVGDAGSIITNPLLTGAYAPNTGSPVINTGINLTSLGITPLNSDKNGSPRPAGSPWTMGAINPASGPAPGLTIAPNSINFGSSAIGVGSSTQTATVTSNGTQTATLGTVVATFSDPQFARTGGTCTASQSLPVGSSCTVILQFTPTSAGVKNASMVVGGNGGNATATIGLSGTGTGGTSSMSVTPTSFDFGSLTVNTASAAHNFMATNTGSTSLTMSSPYFSFSGTNSSDFARVSPGGTDCANGQTLAPAATCLISVTFTPGGVGARTGSLTFLSNLASATATLTGTGTAVPAPSLLITPRPIAFPNTNVGSTSGSQAGTVTNNGNVSVTLSASPVSITGTNAADFTTSGTTCTTGLVLAVSATCNINVTFSPSAAAAETANLAITATTTNNTVAMNGTGVVSPTPGIGLSPSGGVDLGSQIVGTTSSAKTVTVTSTGTANLTLNTPYFTLSGTNAADVTNTGAGTCSNGKIMAPAASCTITLTFNPAGAGARAATLNVAGNASGSLALTGTGIAAVVTLTAAPSPLPFGNVTQSTTSGVQTVTIKNTGNVTATLSTPYYTLTGANAADFTNIATGTCANGGTLAANASCTVNLTFTPILLTSETATLTVSAGAVSITDTLTGTGVAPAVPAVSISPNPIAFPDTNTGATSSGLTVTISNTGSSTLTFSTPFYTLTGTNAADYTRSAGTCVDGGTVAISGSCTIILTFAPAGAGARAGILNIQGNATKSANITGNGIVAVPALTIAPSPRDFGTVVLGNSGSTTVTITNNGTAAATLQAPFYTITGADFIKTGGTCTDGQNLVPAASCTVILSFTPSSATSESATLNISSVTSFTSATDSFTRPDENPIDTNWVAQGSGSVPAAARILNNQFIGILGSAGNSLYTNVAWNPDQSSEAVIAALPSGIVNGYLGLILRGSTTNSNSYNIVLDFLCCHPFGTVNDLNTFAPSGKIASVNVTPHVGDTFKATVVGNVITLFQNGTQLQQMTNNEISSGLPGLLASPLSAPPTSLAWINWTGASLSGPVDVNTVSALLTGTGLSVTPPPAPSPQFIISDLFPTPRITMSGKNFISNKTQITIDGVAQATVCTTTQCIATLPGSAVLLPGFGIIGHTIGVK